MDFTPRKMFSRLSSRVTLNFSRRDDEDSDRNAETDTEQQLFSSNSSKKKRFIWNSSSLKRPKQFSESARNEILPSSADETSIHDIIHDIKAFRVSKNNWNDYPRQSTSPALSGSRTSMQISQSSFSSETGNVHPLGVNDLNSIAKQRMLTQQIQSDALRLRIDTNIPKVFPTRLFSVRNTFYLAPARVRLQIILSLFHLELNFVESNVITVTVPPSSPSDSLNLKSAKSPIELIFTIHLVSVKFTKLIGVQFHKIHGDSIQYSKICRMILEQFKI